MNCSETIIQVYHGCTSQRGLSGGHKKWVNIGIELAADCKILFLDEPTSGPDSTTSLNVCAALKEIAQNENVTLAAVLHQPRYEIFERFDNVLLLSASGRSGQSVWGKMLT